MRILFVVPYAPNLIRTRPYNLIRSLSQRGHPITLFTLYTSETERQELETLQDELQHIIALPLSRWRSLWNSVQQLPQPEPLQSAYCWQPALAQQLIDLVRETQNGRFPFDIIHVEHLRGVRYALALQTALGDDLPIVWDSVDCISHLFRQAAKQSKQLPSRLLTRLELGRTAKYEQWLLHQFKHVLVTSPTDKAALIGLDPNPGIIADRLAILPNGVDLDYFAPSSNHLYDPATIVISGKMSYHANVSMVLHFVKEIMPHIWAQKASAQLLIVGKDPARQIQALAAHPAIKVTGTVPDIRPYLQQAAVAAAPLIYGAGIQNKILEAMACGTPVVTTPAAAAALAAVPNRDLLIAEEPQAFANAILDLLENPSKRQDIQQSGSRYIEENHHWSRITAKLETIYLQVAQQTHTAHISDFQKEI